MSKNNRIRFTVFIITLFLIFTAFGCTPIPTSPPDSTGLPNPGQTQEQPKSGSPESPQVPNTTPGQPAAPQDLSELKVHFIDVGQADSILIQAPSGKTMLIDAGNNADGADVVSYVKKLGITKLDIVVGTHPHEDHVGGLDTVIKALDIGQVVMPNKTHTTVTYKDVLTAIKNKGLKITTAKPGVSLDLGSGVTTKVIGPVGSKYEGLNSFSAVIRLVYGGTSFLFTGDAESDSESDIIASGAELSSTVLKVGHHGSTTSSSKSFLNKVKPKYAVIMVGVGNDYGYPHKETITKLNNIGAKIYRTDQKGTIIFTSDGSNIYF